MLSGNVAQTGMVLGAHVTKLSAHFDKGQHGRWVHSSVYQTVYLAGKWINKQNCVNKGQGLTECTQNVYSLHNLHSLQNLHALDNFHSLHSSPNRLLHTLQPWQSSQPTQPTQPTLAKCGNYAQRNLHKVVKNLSTQYVLKQWHGISNNMG